MKKLSILALLAVVGSLGVSALPAAAATAIKLPYCDGGGDPTISKSIDLLAQELQLSTKQGASVDQANNCLVVRYVEDGHTKIAYYDPTTLNKINTSLNIS